MAAQNGFTGQLYDGFTGQLYEGFKPNLPPISNTPLEMPVQPHRLTEDEFHAMAYEEQASHMDQLCEFSTHLMEVMLQFVARNKVKEADLDRGLADLRRRANEQLDTSANLIQAIKQCKEVEEMQSQERRRLGALRGVLLDLLLAFRGQDVA